MQLIKTQIQEFLKTGDLLSVMKAEKGISFEVIFQTKTIPFCNVAKDNERDLLQSIMKLTQRFIQVNFPEVNAQDVSLQFAVDIIELRPDWSLLDILNFFKFIRQRQDIPENKIFGNKISPLKLMELTAVYENNKSIAREQWHKAETNRIENGTKEDRLQIGSGAQKLLGEVSQVKDTRFADLARELNAKLLQKQEQVYENAQTTKQFLKDIELHWKEQMDMIAEGTITEEEAQINHVKYRDNYELGNKVSS